MKECKGEGLIPHERIRFYSADCPLCKALKEINKLKEAILHSGEQNARLRQNLYQRKFGGGF